MNELKVCPFCKDGGRPSESTTIYYHYVVCNECGCKVGRDKWQTRPIEDKLQARIDELIEQCNRESQIKNGLAESYIAFRKNLKEAVIDIKKIDSQNVRIGDFLRIMENYHLIEQENK